MRTETILDLNWASDHRIEWMEHPPFSKRLLLLLYNWKLNQLILAPFTLMPNLRCRSNYKYRYVKYWKRWYQTNSSMIKRGDFFLNVIESHLGWHFFHFFNLFLCSVSFIHYSIFILSCSLFLFSSILFRYLTVYFITSTYLLFSFIRLSATSVKLVWRYLNEIHFRKI